MEPNRESLLDELARVFARAAVDRLLSEASAKDDIPPADAELAEVDSESG
jgi:hypothetical protein